MLSVSIRDFLCRFPAGSIAQVRQALATRMFEGLTATSNIKFRDRWFGAPLDYGLIVSSFKKFSEIGELSVLKVVWLS